ncbi:phage integrase family protein [Propionivibrio sp.]|uniref:phage integrase family protein n=1 Tax=Propionivibrio sp. TaxID=2212460 RepID=UPI003BF1D748
MAQHNEIETPVVRYTRADFTALRAYLNRVALERIADLYYTEDDREQLGLQDPGDLRARLDTMRDQLVQRASEANPHLAEALRDARRAQRYSKTAIDYLVQAADQDHTHPKRTDPLSLWFRPLITSLLKGEGARTLEGLVDLINARGPGWWKPIPRIGEGKAAAIVRWLQRHPVIAAGFDAAAWPPVPAERTDIVVLDPDAPVLIPFERIGLPETLSGAQGMNRPSAANHRSLISAKNDLQAMEAYLYKFRAQPKTCRSYQKELERFLLWCVLKRRRALSSILFEDCEAYKDFLGGPDERWIGPRAPRLSAQWRPFAGVPSLPSQRYAIQALRSFFSWLVNVRYLAGNPWVTVADPRVEQAIHAMQIEKALPEALWRKLAQAEGVLDQLCATPDDVLRERYRMRGWTAKISMAAQFRLLRAVLLLLGDAGLRREEAATASRSKLKPLPEMPGLWELEVLGKRNKRRTVFLPIRAINALRAHWQDRALDFDYGMVAIPLISPLAIPPTASSRKKHTSADGQRRDAGFTPDGIGQLIFASLIRIADDETVALDFDEREILRRSGAHAFRHTFGTIAAAKEVPLDVLQRALGHASLNTTTIYVQAEKRRSIEELAKLHAKMNVCP